KTSVLLAVLSLPVAVHAVVLCARPRGDGTFNTSVKLRESCKAGETTLDPATLGLQGPPGPTGPTGGQGAPGEQGAVGPPGSSGTGLVVKDANGTIVGAAIDRGFVAVNVDGQSIMLRLNATTGFAEDPDPLFGNFFFVNPDCTGDAIPDGQLLETE